MTLVALAFLLSPAFAQPPPGIIGADRDNCLLCHQFRGLGRYDEPTGKVHLYYVSPDYLHGLLGPHARLACTDCHRRDEVSVIPHQPVSRVDCTQECHLADPLGVARRFSHTNVEEMLERGAHTQQVLSALDFTDGALLEEGQSTCLYCHDEPIFRSPLGALGSLAEISDQTFDRCDVCHSGQIPVDVQYYLRHVAARLQPARPSLELVQVCAVCHADETVRREHELSNTAASYMRSFHGKAALLGDQRTANCISCHAHGTSPHVMLPAENPESSVSRANVATTCSSINCHPGAEKSIGAAAVHLDLPTAGGSLEFLLAAAFIVLTVLTFGPSAFLVCLELIHLAVGRAAHEDAYMHSLTLAVMRDPRGRQKLKRFTPGQRLQHWILAILFIMLAVTGFPMKFAETGWAEWAINLFGGLEVARRVHHWCGLGLILALLVHLAMIIALVLKRSREHQVSGGRLGFFQAWFMLPMWITFDDVRKLLALVAYLLSLRKDRPTFGRFSLKEKFEYLGVFWGTVLLGVTGVLLWGMDVSSHLLTGRVFNLAAIAHTYEAFLAVIHVGVLHIYNVMFSPHAFPLSLATLTGDTPVGEMAEGHGQMVVDAARELGISIDREAIHE